MNLLIIDYDEYKYCAYCGNRLITIDGGTHSHKYCKECQTEFQKAGVSFESSDDMTRAERLTLTRSIVGKMKPIQTTKVHGEWVKEE